MSVVIPIVGRSVAGFGGNICAVHLAIILVGVRDYAAHGTVDAVSVGDQAIEGMMVSGVTVVAMIEGGTGKGSVPSIRNLAVWTYVGSGGDRYWCGGCLTSVGALAS